VTPARPFDTAAAARQHVESMKHPAADEEPLVQLATRIPRRIAREVKAFCVRHDVRMQSFVRTALREKLARARAGERSRRRA
jgi:hypothetical protein